MDILGPLSLIAPWVVAAALGVLPARLDRHARAIAVAGAAAGAGSITLLAAFRTAEGGAIPLAAMEWLPGERFAWSLDGLGALFALLTVWISLLATVFSWHYLPRAQAHHRSDRREAAFYALLSAFTGAMLGLVTSSHLIQFYLFWELTGVASFLLIGFWYAEEEARRGALTSLVLTVAGGLGLLLGLLTLGASTGRWTLDALLASGAPPSAPWLEVATALILVGALAKSAQVPFLNWLPAAMAAPTPVSAFLHSAALVAAGVYAVARFFPVLSQTAVWQPALIVPGVAGMVVAGVLALRQDEIKALLAFSTVAQYSFILVGFGLGSEAGAQAGLYAFYIHAVIKAGLFLVAGAVTHLTGETRLEPLGGLARTHPYLGGLAAISALALGGVPLLGGFYYKEELLHAAHEAGADGLVALMLLGGMITLLYMLRFFQEIFWGRPNRDVPGERLPASMAVPIAILAGLSAVAGILPGRVNVLLLDPAISAVLQRPAPYRVELELGGVTVLSLAVLALGAGLWALWVRERMPRPWFLRLPQRLDLGGPLAVRALRWSGDRALDLHDGNLRNYLRWVLLAAAVPLAACWGVMTAETPGFRGALDLDLTLLLALALLANLATIWLRHHVMAAVALAIAGFSLGAVFARLHAPDVALAQILVETLATVSIVLALRMTGLVNPQRTTVLTAGRRDWGRWAIAAGGGAAVGLATLWVSRTQPGEPVAQWYAANAQGRTGMADTVTAIVTEFRGLDTAIEILVFASAALAVVGLFGRASGR